MCTTSRMQASFSLIANKIGKTVWISDRCLIIFFTTFFDAVASQTVLLSIQYLWIICRFYKCPLLIIDM